MEECNNLPRNRIILCNLTLPILGIHPCLFVFLAALGFSASFPPFRKCRPCHHARPVFLPEPSVSHSWVSSLHRSTCSRMLATASVLRSSDRPNQSQTGQHHLFGATRRKKHRPTRRRGCHVGRRGTTKQTQECRPGLRIYNPSSTDIAVPYSS